MNYWIIAGIVVVLFGIYIVIQRMKNKRNSTYQSFSRTGGIIDRAKDMTRSCCNKIKSGLGI